jgi:hypothetical protein
MFRVSDVLGFAQKVLNRACERPPALALFTRGTLRLAKSTKVILPLVRGRAAEGGRGWLTPHFLCKADVLDIERVDHHLHLPGFAFLSQNEIIPGTTKRTTKQTNGNEGQRTFLSN